MKKSERKRMQERKRGLRILAGMLCLLLSMAAGFMVSGNQHVCEAAKKTSSVKKAKKTAASKKQQPPVLNTNSKTIMKVHEGLFTTYEEYVKYPMNAYTLKVKNKPDGASYQWTSSDPDVATLTYNKKKGTCRVNAKSGGSSIIVCKVKAKGGKTYVLSCSIKVKNPATEIKIVSEDTEIENMECDLSIDRQYQFLANVKSKYTSDHIYWSVTDTEVAEVDEFGFVTPKAEGRTVLTAAAAPEGYDPEIDKYDVVIYAIVIDVIEPMEKVTNVSVMTTGEVVVQFSSEIEPGSVFDVTGKPMGVSLSSMSGSAGAGEVSVYLTDDCLQLYLVPEASPQGKYKLKISGLVAKNGHLVEDYSENVTIKNENISVTGANFVSISRTSQTLITAVFDKTLVKAGTMTVSNSKLTKTDVTGKIGADPSTVLYTLTPEMQELSGVVSVELDGYAASGDSSEEGEENVWIIDVDFTFTTEEETKDTSTLPLPPPSNITQAADDNSKVYVMFQNRVDEESAAASANYAFSGGPVVSGTEVISNSDQGCMVELTLKENSIPQIGEYELSVSGIKGYDNAYLAMENYKETIKLNDNTPAFYKSSEFVKGKTANQLILTFSENIDLGSASNYFDIVASWAGKNEEGVTVNNIITITEYDVKVSGSDNRLILEFMTETEVPVGAKITVAPVNFGGKSGTYLVDEGGNVVQFTSAEIQVSY